MSSQTLTRILLDLLFPPRCAGCRRRGMWLCRTCRSQLQPLPDDHCHRCAQPGVTDQICRRCKNDPPDFASIYCGFIFDGVMRTAIHQFKYRGARHLAEPLAMEALDRARPKGLFDAVVPVPLHRERERRRGYNQSALLARAIAAALDVPIVEGKLGRIKDTPSQMSLPAPQRIANMRGAFQAPVGHFSGSVVLLVDDVATTGSTLRAAAAELRRAGADRVDAFVLARTS